MATKAKSNPAPAVVPEPTSAAWGEYRCPWVSQFGTPCNRLIGYGAGPLEFVCPRCRNKSSLAASRAPLLR